ncbi:hypothetical protein ACSBR1_013119 [Camellia fascicularis]
MLEEERRDEGNGKQVGRSTIDCQFRNAEQCHATTVYVEGQTNSSGQERRSEREAESNPSSPSA